MLVTRLEFIKIYTETKIRLKINIFDYCKRYEGIEFIKKLINNFNYSFKRNYSFTEFNKMT